MAKSNNKTHQKPMDKNCHIPDFVQAFSNPFLFYIKRKGLVQKKKVRLHY